MDFSNLKLINQKNAQAVQADSEHNDLLSKEERTQEVIVKSFQALVDWLDGHTSKTVVVNQLSQIGTPDALKVAQAVESLHDTIKTHENTDLSEITGVMKSILDEAKKIPKVLPDQPKQQFVDYTKQLKELGKAVNAVEKVVKEQKLIAEAPIVNVEPNVNVEAPDLKPLQQGFKDVVKAVKGVVIPEYKTDNTEVEKLLKKSNKLLKDLLNKPVSSGGGGGQAWTAVNTSGIPVPLNLDADGKLLVASTGGGAGTEYTEGDTDASFTGGMALVEGAANTAVTLKQPTQPTDTQPISAASLPLPTGAATSAKQDTGNTSLSSIDGKLTDVATQTTLALIKAKTDNLDTALSGIKTGTDKIIAAPATSAKQDTGNTSLASLDTKLPAQGQALAAASTPVVLPAAQITALTPPAAITGYATASNQTDKSQFTKITDGTDTALVTASGEQNVLETNSAAIKTAVETIDNIVSGAGINQTQVGGTNIDTNSGTKSAGTQRVVLATDQPQLTNALKVDGSAVTQPVSGTFYQATQPVSYATTGSGTATGALRVELPTNGTGTVGLNAGTNAIGKLSANSGVDIGDVDVTSAVSSTLDHGSNLDIDTSAEQITSTSFACKFGVTLKADITNTGIIYIGNSDVTAGTTAATDGFPLSAGETLTLEVTNANIPYAIASANNQKIYWVGV